MSKSVLSFKELTSFFKKGNCKLIVSFRIDTVMLAVFMVKNNIKTNEISLLFALDIGSVWDNHTFSLKVKIS